jgi:hypothetical protein
MTLPVVSILVHIVGEDQQVEFIFFAPLKNCNSVATGLIVEKHGTYGSR